MSLYELRLKFQRSANHGSLHWMQQMEPAKLQLQNGAHLQWRQQLMNGMCTTTHDKGMTDRYSLLLSPLKRSLTQQVTGTMVPMHKAQC